LKTIFKYTVVLLAFAVLLAVPAKAQNSYTPNYYSVTLSNAASTAAITMGTFQDTSNNWSKALGPLRQKSVTVSVTFSNSAATSTAFTLYYQRSTDNVNFESTLQPAAFTVAALSSVQLTNLDMNGCGYIKFAYLTNASATVNATNIGLNFPLNYNAK